MAAECSCGHMSCGNLVIGAYVDGGEGPHCLSTFSTARRDTGSVSTAKHALSKNTQKARSKRFYTVRRWEANHQKALFLLPGSAALIINIDFRSGAVDAVRMTMAWTSPLEKECCRRDLS